MLGICKPKIFVSYSHEDKDFAKRLVKSIETFGYDLWFDTKSNHPGDKISQEVERAIKKRQIFIVIISKNSCSSNWVLWELNEALWRKALIIPIVIDRSPNQSLLDKLRGIVSINFKEVDYEEGINRILMALKRHERLGIKKVLLLTILFVIVMLMFAILIAFGMLKSEIKRIEDVQARIQMLDDQINKRQFAYVVDSENRRIAYKTVKARVVGRDDFDITNNYIQSRSYYDNDGRRIAIDRFEWTDDVIVRKVRTHYNKEGDEYLRETFSRTGKLEKKQYDKYKNGHFVEREADFVTSYPVLVVFPIYYR